MKDTPQEDLPLVIWPFWTTRLHGDVRMWMEHRHATSSRKGNGARVDLIKRAQKAIR